LANLNIRIITGNVRCAVRANAFLRLQFAREHGGHRAIRKLDVSHTRIRIDDASAASLARALPLALSRRLFAGSGNMAAINQKQHRSTAMSLGTILLIILVLLLVGALPTWPYSSGWGYYPTGGLGLVLLIVIILLILGRI
jgi:Protein of unknown function (DUF3309)